MCNLRVEGLVRPLLKLSLRRARAGPAVRERLEVRCRARPLLLLRNGVELIRKRVLIRAARNVRAHDALHARVIGRGRSCDALRLAALRDHVVARGAEVRRLLANVLRPGLKLVQVVGAPAEQVIVVVRSRPRSRLPALRRRVVRVGKTKRAAQP